MISFNSICTKDDVKLISKYSLSVDIKKDCIEDVIDKLLNIDLSNLDRVSCKLINKDLDYLDNLTLKNDISIMLKFKYKGLMSVEPISAYTIRLLAHNRVISFDIADILKALAFRHLHYEFGYSLLDIEDNLKGTKMIVRNSPDSLMKLVNSNIDSLLLLKDFKITDYSYISSDRSYAYDHFSNKVCIKDNYNPVIQSTFSNACLFSIIDLSKQLFDCGVQFEPLGCMGTNIYFLLGNDIDYKKLSDMNLVLEVFGRKFKFDLDFTLGGSLENVN